MGNCSAVRAPKFVPAPVHFLGQ